MAFIKLERNSEIRQYVKDLVQPLVDSKVLSKVYTSDAHISDKKFLPALCVYLTDGESESETLDEATGFDLRAILNFKIKTYTNNVTGDDALDDLGNQVADIINQDLQLGGLLKERLDVTSFLYINDPNDIYSVLHYDAEILFKQ